MYVIKSCPNIFWWTITTHFHLFVWLLNYKTLYLYIDDTSCFFSVARSFVRRCVRTCSGWHDVETKGGAPYEGGAVHKEIAVLFRPYVHVLSGSNKPQEVLAVHKEPAILFRSVRTPWADQRRTACAIDRSKHASMHNNDARSLYILSLYQYDDSNTG
jgi:hypothetical protein